MSDFSHLCGLHVDKREVDKVLATLPVPYASDGGLVAGSGAGKTTLLYEFVEKIIGRKLKLRTQVGPDCVSMGAAMAVDIVKAVQSILEGTNQEWIAETATEPLYGGSRVEIGRGQLGNGGGSMGVWAAKYVNQYGTLPRGKYGNIDLSVYDYSKAEAWGRPRGGVPDSLEEESRKNCIKTISLIRTWEELRDAIANGYAVTIASGQGFSSTRDKDGFARPSGSWPHQMCIGGAKDDNRPGGLILNSWGAWNSGPKGEFDIPEGSFWCDAQVLERNILSQGDSWAFSNLDGYPARELDLRWS